MPIHNPYLRGAATMLLLACTGAATDPCEDPSDFLCGADLPLEIGVGEASFVPVGDGATVELVRGPQSAQHVVFALRAPWVLEELPLDRASVSLEAWQGEVEQGLSLSIGQQLTGDEAQVTVLNLLWVVPDPDPLLGQEVEILAEVAPVGLDEIARGRARVVVQWAPGEL